MKNYLLISLVILVLIGCNSSGDELKIHEQKQKIAEQQELKFLSEIADKYSIQYSLDTLQFSYSIQFDEVIITEYQMIRWFRIEDIYNKDNMFFVKIETKPTPPLYLNLQISETELKKLLLLDKSRNNIAGAAMVVKLHEIKKFDLKFESYFEDENCHIEFENSGSFIGNGDVIEVFLTSNEH